MVKHLFSAALAVTIVTCEARAGDIFDAVADFSDSVNSSSSTWSYRFSQDLVRDGSYALIGGPSGALWVPGTILWNAGGFRWIAVNRTGVSVNAVTVAPFPWPNDTILMHPGGNETGNLGLVVLSWLAPSDGIADLSFTLTDLDRFGGNGVDWFIDLGDAAGNLAAGTLHSTTLPLATTGLQTINDVNLIAGDRISFIVGPGAGGSHIFDSTGLTATIDFTSGSSSLDSDGDGLLDSTELEIAMGSGCPDPFDPDSDGDTLLDGAEVALGTNPCNVDTDGDGLTDDVDPLPTEPGATSGFLEDAARDLAAEIQALDLAGFNGPNNNANRGRRNALANRATDAANLIAAGDIPGAIDKLTSLLEKIDDLTPPADWLEASVEKTGLADDVAYLIMFLVYLL
ncbi:MAG: hypothetical protein V3T70_03190 [Phycisphaerae bacterium]